MYWPVVFWMYDVSGSEVLKYKPSTNHSAMPWFVSYNAALKCGIKALGTMVDNVNIHAMPHFIVKVLEQDEQPDITMNSPLRLFVRRILVNND